MFDMAEQADTVFVARVVSVDGLPEKPERVWEITQYGPVVVSVKSVISGRLEIGPATLFTVRRRPANDMLDQVLKPDDEILVFGTRDTENAVRVADDGRGLFRLYLFGESVETAAAKRLIEILSLKDEDAKNRAMLEEVKSNNARLRIESRRYLSVRLFKSELRQQYKDVIVELLNDNDRDLQLTVLDVLESVHADAAIPRMIELTRSDDAIIAQTASMTLAYYETPESVAARIALTSNPDAELRMRGCLDLSNSRAPDARAALIRCLDDQDARVREKAITGLVLWIRWEQAEDVLPRIIALLDDPADSVRAEAAYALGETDNLEVVNPLIGILARKNASRELLMRTLEALAHHANMSEGGNAPLIVKNIDLIVDVLKGADFNEGFGPATNATSVLTYLARQNYSPAMDALRWVADTHRDSQAGRWAKDALELLSQSKKKPQNP